MESKQQNSFISMPIPAILAALGTVASKVAPYAVAGASMAASSRQAKLNHKRAVALANKEFQQNKEMWSLTNQYNSPAMASNRLKSAGLSPALAYGGSSAVVGNADSTPNLDYSGAINTPAFADPKSSISQGLSVSQLQSQIDLNESAAQRNIVEALRTKELTPEEKNLLKQNILTAVVSRSNIAKQTEQIEKNLDLIIAQTQLTDEQRKNVSWQIEFNNEVRSAMVEQYSLQNDYTKSQIREINSKIRLQSQEVEKLISDIQVNQAEIYNLDSSSLLNDGKYWNTLKESEEIQARIDKIAEETHLTHKEVKWYVINRIVDIVNGTVRAGSSALGAAGTAKLARLF